jgi:hypothetical protein
MRIPSQFNDSSLYRTPHRDRPTGSARRFPEGAGTRRRLLRLGAALLLVLVVMRQAKQTQVYEPFFANGETTHWVPAEANPAEANLIPARPGQVDPGQPRPSLGDRGPGALADVTGGRTDAESAAAGGGFGNPLTAAWVDTMDVPLQRRWLVSLVHLRSSAASRTTPDTVAWRGLSAAQLARSIDSLGGLASPRPPANPGGGFLSSQVGNDLQRLREDLQRLREDARGGRVPAGRWPQIADWANPLLERLQASAVDRVDDGTFWTSRDRDAFHSLLALTATPLPGRPSAGAGTPPSAPHAGSPPVTGTLPLLQQADAYRGKRVRVEGRLQLVQRREARANPFGIEQYWKLWLIPEDGGVRPTLLITARLPERVAQAIDDQGRWDREARPDNRQGRLAAEGTFIKRLPYRSSIGPDLAPVVIGRVVAVQGVSPTPPRPASPPAAGPGEVAPQGTEATWNMGKTWGVAGAVLVAIALAVLLMRRTSKEAHRSRQLRQRGQEAAGIDWAGLESDVSPAHSAEHNEP